LKKDSTVTQEFTARISETNPYHVLVTSNFEAGKKYQLTIPKKTISSYYDKIGDPYRLDFEADKVENYGSLAFILTNAPTLIIGFSCWILPIRYCIRNIQRRLCEV
jgi:hypothetical protein